MECIIRVFYPFLQEWMRGSDRPIFCRTTRNLIDALNNGDLG